MLRPVVQQWSMASLSNTPATPILASSGPVSAPLTAAMRSGGSIWPRPVKAARAAAEAERGNAPRAAVRTYAEPSETTVGSSTPCNTHHAPRHNARQRASQHESQLKSTQVNSSQFKSTRAQPCLHVGRAKWAGGRVAHQQTKVGTQHRGARECRSEQRRCAHSKPYALHDRTAHATRALARTLGGGGERMHAGCRELASEIDERHSKRGGADSLKVGGCHTTS
jgi:hypothetical protein